MYQISGSIRFQPDIRELHYPVPVVKKQIMKLDKFTHFIESVDSFSAT